jgi:hypothetical protein
MIKTEKAIIEIYCKRQKAIIARYAAEEWMNPKFRTTEDTDYNKLLRPKTYYQAYTMLLDMVQGEIFQNVKYACRIQDAKHKWALP